MTVGEKIRKYRKERKLTQKQLGELCGINESQIRRYELGLKNSNPKIETLQKIADALDMSLFEFLDDDYFDVATDEEPGSLERASDFLENKLKSITDNKNISDKEKSKQIHDIQVQTEIMAELHLRNFEVGSENLLNMYFNQLNLLGKEKAIEQIEMLTKIPEYKKIDDIR